MKRRRDGSNSETLQKEVTSVIPLITGRGRNTPRALITLATPERILFKGTTLQRFPRPDISCLSQAPATSHASEIQMESGGMDIGSSPYPQHPAILCDAEARVETSDATQYIFALQPKARERDFDIPKFSVVSFCYGRVSQGRRCEWTATPPALGRQYKYSSGSSP